MVTNMSVRDFQTKVNFKPISPLIDEFIEYKKLNTKYATYKKYYYNLRKFYRFTGDEIVTKDNLKLFLDHIEQDNKIGPGQYNHILIAIKNYTRYLCKINKISDIQFLDLFKLKRYNVQRDKKFYTMDEIEQLLQKLNELKVSKWVYWFLWFGFMFGIRPKEMSHLDISDIDIDNWIIHLRSEITKTGYEDSIAIPKKLQDKMRQLLTWRSLKKTDCPRLFVNKYGNPITENNLRNVATEIRKIDPSFTFYHMRYTAGWRAYSKTGDIYFAAQLLRHKNVQQTRSYLQIQKKERLKKMREKMEEIY